MKFKDINAAYTAAIAEYLAKGYRINTGTMSGSQGEIAHTDLTDGTEIIRILLDRGYNRGMDHTDLIVGRVNRESERIEPDEVERGSGIWNQRLEIIAKRIFAMPRGRGGYGENDFYFEADPVEFDKIESKKIERWRQNRPSRQDRIEYPAAIGIKYIKRKGLIKNPTRATRVSVYKRAGEFIVEYKNNQYKLS